MNLNLKNALHIVALIFCFFTALSFVSPSIAKLFVIVKEARNACSFHTNASQPTPIPYLNADIKTLLNLTSYTALGDSYAAGTGAGHLKTTKPCNQYWSSYPEQIHRSPLLTAMKTRNFTNLACGGSLTTNVTSTQLPAFRVNPPQAATLSVGGNDANFFRVIDACIYRFSGPWAGDCEEELLGSMSGLRSVVPYALEKVYRAVLAAASNDNNKNNDGFKLFVTTYPCFFNAKTPACNGASFAYWPGEERLLTQKLRRRINSLVVLMAEVIEQAARHVNEEVGAERIVVVDVDALFEGHRFCEEGVEEPDPTNPKTWFFNTGTPVDGELGEADVWPPERWLRVFHPTSAGHGAVAGAVVAAMTAGMLLGGG